MRAIKTVVPLMVGESCEFRPVWPHGPTCPGRRLQQSPHPPQLPSIGGLLCRSGHAAPNEDVPESDTFEFLDPRSHAEMSALPGETVGWPIAINPLSGRMVLFPSWLYHQVKPYHGDAERISVSCNAHISNLQRV